MTQEEKELLLKDLCARIPYWIDLRIQYNGNDYTPFGYGAGRISMLSSPIMSCTVGYAPMVEEVKPYLRPMSSMTEGECITLSKLIPYETDAWKYIKTPIPLYIANIEQFDFFHRHHLDWRGLIPKGLALEAPEGMYKEN